MTHRIVVAGGGMVGLAAAAAFARSQAGRQLEITLVDPGDGPPTDAGDVGVRVSAIASDSARLLEELGAWQGIRPERCQAYQRMCVWDAVDAPDSPRAVVFDAAEMGATGLGYIVENAEIQRALHAVLANAEVTLRYNATIDSLSTASLPGRLSLSNGDELEFDLLVAADGRGSTIRRALGIDTRDTDYRQQAVVTHLRPEFGHESTAWQRFLDTGPVALLPLADGRVSTVWSTTPEIAREALDADDDALGEMLTEASGRVLGKLTVEGPRGGFPLHAQHAERYVETGIALVGDAAHGIHPMAGQGANLGLRDVACLADLVGQAIAGREHPGSRRVLRRYERQRRGDNATMLNGLTALNTLFSSRSAVIGEIRRYGMQLFNHSGPLRERVAREAIGAVSD